MARDFAEADKIRDHLRDKGVEILERERRWQHKRLGLGIYCHCYYYYHYYLFIYFIISFLL